MVGWGLGKLNFCFRFGGGGGNPKTFQKSKMVSWLLKTQRLSKRAIILVFKCYIWKLILWLLISSKNDCSFGRGILNKEMKAQTGTYPTSREEVLASWISGGQGKPEAPWKTWRIAMLGSVLDHAWICRSFCPWSWVWECKRMDDTHLGQQLPFLEFPEKAMMCVGVRQTLRSVGGTNTLTCNPRLSLWGGKELTHCCFVLSPLGGGGLSRGGMETIPL